MGLSATTMDTNLKNLLGDPNGYRWDHSKRMIALNQAQRDIVNILLGMTQSKPNYSLLSNLHASSTIAVTSTDGYALSGLASTPGPPIGEQGFIRARGQVDTDTLDFIHITPESGEGGDNYYTQGTAAHPLIRFEGGKVYIEINAAAAYSKNVELVYIRQPKALVTDGATGYQTDSCDLNISLHDLVVRLAEAYCRRMADDFEQYAAIRQEVMNDLAMIAASNININPSRNELE